MALKTDYKDYVFLDQKKFKMITNPDGTISFEDVTDYSIIGDDFGALDVNAITMKINEMDKKSSFAENIIDCNEVEENGIFHTNSSTLNCPIDNSAGFLMSMVENNKLTRVQYWTRYRDNRIYIREYNKVNVNSDGTTPSWSDWEDISVHNLKNWSTEEVRIGTYMGKPLYRRVISGICNKTYARTDIKGIDKIVNHYGICRVAGQTYEQNGYRPFPYIGQGVVFEINSYSDEHITFSSYFDNNWYECTLEYTKVTD